MTTRWLLLGCACVVTILAVGLGIRFGAGPREGSNSGSKVVSANEAVNNANGVVLRTSLLDDWPQFRGPGRDDISKEKGLLKEWPKGGPKLAWKTDKAGLGFSGVSVVGDVVYTMGAMGDDEFALALSAKDGKQLWATKLGPIFTFKNNTWGDGPRGTPTVDGDMVYCLAGFGELLCLKRDKGEVVWRKNLLKDFNGQIMVYSVELTGSTGWGYCESPLIDGDQLICCPGGPDGWMLALDKKTGTQRWRTKDIADEATDSSTVVAEIGGVRQYINSTFKGTKGGGSVAGIDAKSGKVLWYFPIEAYNIYAICPTPIVKDNLVYVTAGYGAGCNLLEITKEDGGKFSVKDLYGSNNRARTAMQNEHGGVVLIDGHIYGHCDKRGWRCQELMKGKDLWTERNALDGGGSLACADGHLYLLSDQGEVALLKVSNKAWDEKGRFMLPELSATRKGNRATHSAIGVWTHPVVANGQLYLRDQELIFCYTVK